MADPDKTLSPDGKAALEAGLDAAFEEAVEADQDPDLDQMQATAQDPAAEDTPKKQVQAAWGAAVTPGAPVASADFSSSVTANLSSPGGSEPEEHAARIRSNTDSAAEGAEVSFCQLGSSEDPHARRELKIVLAGFGGQGVLFAGKLIAFSGLIDQRQLSWMPSYGPEMRGGTANCSVTLSDEPIGSPMVLEPDALIALNQPSLDKFVNAVEPGGIIIANTTLCPELEEAHAREKDGVRVIELPATSLAEEHGLKGLGNILCVGRLWYETHFCPAEVLLDGLKRCIPARKAHLLEPNIQALQIGSLDMIQGGAISI